MKPAPVSRHESAVGHVSGRAVYTDEQHLPLGMLSVFPDTGAALVCASADPWSSPSQTWSGEWEGQLPFAVSAGRFDTSDGTLFVGTGVSFCEWGVLGENDVAASGLSADDPLAGYVGDRLVFTGELIPSIQAALDAGTTSRIASPSSARSCARCPRAFLAKRERGAATRKRR